jgi:hypothetical protein
MEISQVKEKWKHTWLTGQLATLFIQETTWHETESPTSVWGV